LVRKRKFQTLENGVPAVVSTKANQHDAELRKKDGRDEKVRNTGNRLWRRSHHFNDCRDVTLGTLRSVLNCILVSTGLTTFASTIVVSYLNQSDGAVTGTV
jgi:hypothetical protein